MVVSSWTASEVTRECLQNLMSKGYMTTSEFATSLVPTGPVSPALAVGFIVVFVAFFERGFASPSHRFLQSYVLELHHLTPSVIRHMAAFVTLCEAYIGIEPPLNLLSHFFRAWLRPNLTTGAASLGSVEILVRISPKSDAYALSHSPTHRSGGGRPGSC
jgi:hypothetical protein